MPGLALTASKRFPHSRGYIHEHINMLKNVHVDCSELWSNLKAVFNKTPTARCPSVKSGRRLASCPPCLRQVIGRACPAHDWRKICSSKVQKSHECGESHGKDSASLVPAPTFSTFAPNTTESIIAVCAEICTPRCSATPGSLPVGPATQTEQVEKLSTALVPVCHYFEDERLRCRSSSVKTSRPVLWHGVY